MSDLLTIAETAERLRTTRGALAQMRYLGTGPRFLKPTPRKVLYREADIVVWLESTVRASTAA